MSVYGKEQLRSIVQDAVELASEAPDSMRDEIVPILLRHMLAAVGSKAPSTGLAASPSNDTSGQDPAREENASSDVSNGRADWEQDVITRLPEAHVVADGSRTQQAVWAIVRLRQKGEPATTDSVRKVIQTDLGLTPQSRKNTSTTLGNLVPKHVRREKEGRGYVYFPTRRTLDVFDD